MIKLLSYFFPFGLFFYFIFSFKLHSHDFTLLNKCKISIKNNPNFQILEQSDESILFIDNKNENIITILCLPNWERIFKAKEKSLILDLEFNDIHQKKYILKGFIESKKIYARKSYHSCILTFFTRDYLYKILFYSENPKNVPLEKETCKQFLLPISENIYFTEEIHIAITEKEYKIRFFIVVFLGMFLLMFQLLKKGS